MSVPSRLEKGHMTRQARPEAFKEEGLPALRLKEQEGLFWGSGCRRQGHMGQRAPS